jgi:DNA-binding NarL/FixJ family response regulator
MSIQSGGIAVKVVLASDHPVALEGLTAMFSHKAEIAGRASGPQELTQIAETVQPDLVLMDVEKPRFEWIRAMERLRSSVPAAACACVSASGDDAFLEEMRTSGAVTRMIDSEKTRDLLRLFEEVSGVPMGPGGSALRRPHREASLLSPREREILRLVASGHMNHEIARDLGLSVRTVEFHRANILRKTGARTAADLTRLAIQSGVLTGAV